MPGAPSSLPLSAAPMASSSSTSGASPPPPPLNPIAAISSLIQHHLSQFSARLDQGLRTVSASFASLSTPPPPPVSLAASSKPRYDKYEHAFDLALGAADVARTLSGTSVYTVSNANNEFVLISDPSNGMRSLGLLCFRQEDAEALLSQVKTRHPTLGKGARVVPLTLDQVYMLKVEGIAFRFLPDPLQIKHALKLKSSEKGFDGVPIFQSDLLVIKKKNRRYCPIYFQREDIEKELTKASRQLRDSSLSQQIVVGSLEDVLKKMEMNDKDSGWDDLIFIPPGKSSTQHLNEVSA